MAFSFIVCIVDTGKSLYLALPASLNISCLNKSTGLVSLPNIPIL